MTTVPNPHGMATPQPTWLRHSTLTHDQICAFLQEGAFFAWGEDSWLVAWGEAEKSSHPHPNRPSFYTPDFVLSDPSPWRSYPHVATISPDNLAQQIPSSQQLRSWQAFDEEAFAQSFRTVLDAIHAGTLRKAVPAVFEYSPSPLQPAERGHSLRALTNLPAGLIPYGFWDRNHGILGASPELLFENDASSIHTMAVAGTTRTGIAPDDLLADPKERNEHNLVLEDIASRLSPLGSVSRDSTRPWRIGMISHLRTNLHLAPREPVTFTDLIQRLHPTPAVGIAPRGDWRDWTHRIDSAPRDRFSAPFGILFPGGRSHCLVAIRNVQWDTHTTRCGAGCGIVSESQPDHEINELRLKLSVTRSNLGL